jgi:O-glycosyl hydrolase
VKAAFPNLKIFGPETMLSGGPTYVRTTLLDPTAKGLLDIVACHGYKDGVNPVPTSAAASLWKSFATVGALMNKHVWMTETSGFAGGWAGAYEQAEAMYAALKYGKISAWVFWMISGEIMNTPAYYANKQFWRYVRPDAIAIEATEDPANANVHALAFRHKTKKTLTLILMNSATSPQTVGLAGDLANSFEMYKSDASTNCAGPAAMAPNAQITISAKGIVTLVGANYNPVVAVHSSIAITTRAMALDCMADRDFYSIDGRRVSLARSRANGVSAHNLLISIARNGSGGGHRSALRSMQ